MSHLGVLSVVLRNAGGAVPRAKVVASTEVRGDDVKKTAVLTIGALMFVVGAVFTFQGLGVLKGSGMTGVETWAIVGPLVAGFGVALVFLGLRSRR
jgi:hypothetical protein